MKYISAATQEIDEFRAGLELGETLRLLSPEVVLLFCSVDYLSYVELLDGLFEGLGTRDVVVFGGTGDGIFESNLVADRGCSALGANSDGKIRWHSVSCQDSELNSYGKTKFCVDGLESKCHDKLSLVIALADFHENGTEVAKALNLLGGVPCIGGFVSDDRRLDLGFIFADGCISKSGVAVLGIEGELDFIIRTGSGWVPHGEMGEIEEVEYAKVNKISGMSAVSFVERELGKGISFIDKGVLCFYVADPKDNERSVLRGLADHNTEEGSITLFGAVEKGETIQLCVAQPDDMVNGVRTLIHSIKETGFQPKAGLVISCAGRKWILGNSISHEVTMIFEQFGYVFPLAGFPSLGEFAPVTKTDGTKEACFHNITYAILLFGS